MSSSSSCGAPKPKNIPSSSGMEFDQVHHRFSHSKAQRWWATPRAGPDESSSTRGASPVGTRSSCRAASASRRCLGRTDRVARAAGEKRESTVCWSGRWRITGEADLPVAGRGSGKSCFKEKITLHGWIHMGRLTVFNNLSWQRRGSWRIAGICGRRR